MQFCFGCLHAFPTETLQPVGTFGEDLSLRLQSIRSLVSRVHATNAQTRQSVAGIEEELRRLTLAIDAELQKKQKSIDHLSLQLKHFHDQEDEERLRQKLAAQKAAARPPPRKATAEAGQHAYASRLLQRFMAVSHKQPMTPRRPGTGAINVENRFGANVVDATREVPDVMHAPDDPDHKPTVPKAAGTPRRAGRGGGGTGGARASDLVGATVYNTLEYASVRTRAALGVLWLSADEADELVAPFLVGEMVRHGVLGMAPVRIRVGSSTAGTVLSTGIAVNALREPSHGDGRGVAAHDEPAAVAHLLKENGHRSGLLLPIYRKYGAIERQTIGVLQLIGWPSASPFTGEDENVAAASASMLSHILSTYAKFAPAWNTRIYDPALMSKEARYYSHLDTAKGNPGAPGPNVLDDLVAATHPPMLVYRSDTTKAAVDGAASVSGKITRQDIAAQGTGQVPVAEALKEVERYTSTLEGSWKQAVGNQQDLQRRCDQLQRQLDAAKQGLSDRRSQGFSGFKSMRDISHSMRAQASEEAEAASPSTRSRHQTFSGAELEELAAEAELRLKGLQDGGSAAAGGSARGGSAGTSAGARAFATVVARAGTRAGTAAGALCCPS